ncbi:MAG: type VI secretion system contractile sheath large subunit [Pirellulales bacterium]
MRYQVNFGNLSVTSSPLKAASGKFRIAVLGDFSGRANRGQLATGDELAKRKPLRVDADNLEDIFRRFNVTLRLPLAADGGVIEIPVTSLDELHPDELYGNVELFSELGNLRKRLKNTSTFAAAAKEVQSWSGGDDDEAEAARPVKPRGSAIPHGKLSDFARLVGQAAGGDAEEASIKDLLKQIVGPHVVPAKDPKQDKLVATVDAALSDAMRRVLHDPDFQALEALWRSVDLLVRRLECDESLQVVLFDITAEEIAADLSQASDLTETGLYKLLVEQPALDANQGAFAALLGMFVFEQTPPHCDLLGRLARIAVCAKAPFVAGISNDCLAKRKPEDEHPLVKQAWADLRALPEAAYLGLVAPRFLLRWPYGKKTEPITPFAFEEFTPQSGVKGMLWGNGAVLAGLLLGATFQQEGLQGMKLGTVLTVNDLPYYYYTDADGDQIALPCTDRLLSEALCMHVTSLGIMPLVALKGRAEVRLASFQSLAGRPLLGPWSSEQVAVSTSATPTSAPAAAPPASAPEAAPAPAAAAAPAETPAEAAAAADSELDALLASLGGGESPPPAAEGADAGIDPDLAALLADL